VPNKHSGHKPTQNNQHPKIIQVPDTPERLRRRVMSLIATLISSVLFVFGAESMSMVDNIAPWLMAFGGLVVALAILFNEDVWSFISKKLWRKLLMPIVLCIVLTVPAFLYFHNLVVRQSGLMENTEIYFGHITPGSEPDPVANIPPNALTIMFGNNVGVFMRKDQTYIFADQDHPLISIGFDSNGVMLLNADVFNSKNNQVVHIENSIIRSSLKYAFHPIQDDSHTLLVYDFNNIQVLSVDYMNADTIRISGRFYIKGYSEPFIITPESDIHFDGFDVNNTKPFMFDITGNPIHGFLNITADKGLNVAGHDIGKGTAK